tara:strand:+ start:181 stop:405 length:225 start_codon:yes stop_codon:yes gene_type:complete
MVWNTCFQHYAWASIQAYCVIIRYVSWCYHTVFLKETTPFAGVFIGVGKASVTVLNFKTKFPYFYQQFSGTLIV